MLLRQLVNFRPAAGPDHDSSRPYSRDRRVRWELNLDRDGQFQALVDLADPTDKNARSGRMQLVPNAGRTVAIAPSLGADDVQYVLGWCDEQSKPERVAAAHAAFVALCRRWSREHPDDDAARAIIAFYDGGGVDLVPKRDKWTSKETATIVVDGRPSTDSDALWQLWQTVVEERKSGGDIRHGLCLACGRVGALLNRMPQALPKALVPGADQEVALISANKSIHTYDFSEGLGTAPICVGCGRAAVANLQTILADPTHTFTYPRQRTRLAWWITHGGHSATIALLDANPAVISDYLDRVHTATPPRSLREHQLCSVAVSGNVARLVVHDWIEQPLAEAEAAVQGWFADHEITHRWQDHRARFPMWLLLTCAGQWQPGTTRAQGHYIPLYDKAADRPDDLAQLLLHSALYGAHLPSYILAHVVRRIRTDGHVDEPRAALIRVALTRHPHTTVEAPMPGLDPTQDDPAYVSGRLFAVLEATQRAAFPREEQPNTTFFDRYFAGAVANPRVALVQGSQLWPAWIKKITSSAERERTPQGRNRRLAAAAALRTRITDLLALLNAEALPARITTEAQSLFIVGYHHQRADDLARARAGRAPEIAVNEQDQPEQPLDAVAM